MFAWADYLRLAKELCTRTESESALRTAISRAYYSAFCTAAWHRYPDGPPFSTQRDRHTIVWNEFRQSGRDCAWIGLNGDRLKRYRINADYEPEFSGDLAKTAELVISEAQKILDYCRMHPKFPAP
jgi:uncharacterized protein (UPF0332 family)